MDSKHTKGPWRVEEGTTLIWGDCNPDDNSSYGMGYPIAECRLTPSGSWARGPRKYEEAEANARLVAAAPDLLHFVEKVRDYARETDDESLYAAADDLISKAEGK